MSTKPDNTNDNNQDTKNTDYKPTLEQEWLIRPCCIYEEEYSDCTSFRARFNQYFIFGKLIDCTQWKRDTDNCNRWIDNKDTKAGNELIKSEKSRRIERLAPHYTNNVWERRKTPPENWNKPLPEYLQKQYENTYLHRKAKEIRGEIEPAMDPTDFCVIM